MNYLSLKNQKFRRITIGGTTLLAIALVATFIVTQMSAGATNQQQADPTIVGPEMEMFADGNFFTDDFRAEFRLKFNEQVESSANNPPRQPGSRETYERLVNDASNMVMLSLTFDPEDGAEIGGIPWHNHPGPLLVSVAEGALTVTWSSDCKARTYEAGDAFVDLGEVVHKAENFSGEETVVYIAGFGIPEGEPITNVVADDEGFEEPC